MTQIGIVIVTYNSQSEIGPCLDSARATDAEIVVIDNASRDATVAEATRRGVRVIANATNRGFAAAANQGFAVLQQPYVLLLNPDTVVVSDLEPLRAACNLPGAAGAGGCLLDAKGHPQIGFMVRRLPTPASLCLEALLLNRLFPNQPVNRRYRALDLDYGVRQPVEQPAGAFLMIRRAVWEELGGFDEGFAPLWFEDVDFCRRALDRGYSLYYAPDAVAKHTGGHSIPRIPVGMRPIYWYGNLLRYSARHFRPLPFRMVCLAVVTGSFLRLAEEVVVHGSLKSLAAHGKVLRLAGRCLVAGWHE